MILIVVTCLAVGIGIIVVSALRTGTNRHADEHIDSDGRPKG